MSELPGAIKEEVVVGCQREKDHQLSLSEPESGAEGGWPPGLVWVGVDLVILFH